MSPAGRGKKDGASGARRRRRVDMDPDDRASLADLYACSLRGELPSGAEAAYLEALEGGSLIDPARGALSAKGRARIRVTLAGGVFDIIHPGHIHMLRQAAEIGDVLVVVVATNATAVKMKRRRPLHTQEQRQMIVGALSMVDACVVGDERDMFTTVRRVSPDVIALGYDQAHQESSIIEGCRRVGVEAEIRRLGAVDGDMSSRTIEELYGDAIHGI